MKKILLFTLIYACFTAVGCGDKSNTPGGGTVTPPSLPVVSLSPSKNPVNIGESTTISWSSTVPGVYINNAPKTGTSGSFTLTPASDTTFTITAWSPAGTGTQSLKIVVLDSNLIAGPWRIFDIEFWPPGGSGWISIGGTGNIVPCELDDLNYFYADETTKTTFGTLHCNPNEADLHGTWRLVSTGQLMWGHLFNYTASATMLRVDYLGNDGNRYRITYSH